VQENHLSLSNAKQNARNPVARQVASNLPESTAERPAKRHADRPPHLDQAKVATKSLPVFSGQGMEPIANRLSACLRAVKSNR
jgi:hypothetical protein